MLRRRLQQYAAATAATSLAAVLGLLVAHLLLRPYQPHVAHGRRNTDFAFEGGEQAGGDDVEHPAFALDGRVLAGAAAAFAVSCAVDAGGVGWGALHVGVYFLVVGFDLKAATGLSQAAILGASLAAVAANLLRAAPQAPAHSYKAARAAAAAAAAGAEAHAQQQQQLQLQQPLVDLDLVLLLTPGLLLGIAVGAVLNEVLPDWAVTGLLVAVLLYSCLRTALRGLLAWHAETAAEASQAAAAAILSRPLPALPPLSIAVVSSSSGSSDAGSGGGSGAGSDASRGQGPFGRAPPDEAGPEAAATEAGSDGGPVALAPDGSLLRGAGRIGSAATVASCGAASSSVDSLARPMADPGSPCYYAETTPVSPLAPSGPAPAPAAAASPPPRQPPAPQEWGSLWRSQPVPAQQRQAGGWQHTLSPCEWPWLRLSALAAMWGGYGGLLLLLNGGLALCSWAYVGLLLLVTGVTVCLTATLIRVVLVEPLVGARQVGRLVARAGQAIRGGGCSSGDGDGGGGGRNARTGARAAGARFAAAGCWLRATAHAAPGAVAAAWRAAPGWLHVLSGFGRPAQPPAAATDSDVEAHSSAAELGEEQEQKLSLFARARLAQQRRPGAAGQPLLAPLLVDAEFFAAAGGGGAPARVWRPPQLAAAAYAAADAACSPPLGEEQPWRAEAPFPPAAGGGGGGGDGAALVAVAVAASVVGCAGGVLSAVTGVGGSVLLLPVLLDYRVSLSVASASTAACVMLSSAAAVLSFVLQGRLLVSYACLFGGVSLAGGCVGVGACGALAARACPPPLLRRRRSLLVLTLAAALGVAGVGCGAVGALRLAGALREGEPVGFRAVCELG